MPASLSKTLAAFACLTAPAQAQSAGVFAHRSFDVMFTEVQATDDPARPEIPQNRRTQIAVSANAASTSIMRNWDKPPPGLENLVAAGPIGEWISLEHRARLRHSVEGKRFTQTILTSSFVTRLIIELDGGECRARVENNLLPGEGFFRMRNIALGTPMRITAIRTEGQPECAVAEERLW